MGVSRERNKELMAAMLARCVMSSQDDTTMAEMRTSMIVAADRMGLTPDERVQAMTDILNDSDERLGNAINFLLVGSVLEPVTGMDVH